jgi:hypothetical protein
LGEVTVSCRALLKLYLLAGIAALGWGAAAFLSALLPACTARAQINSNLTAVNLAATLNTSLTLLAAPNLVNFALVQNGISNGSTPITVTTIWSLRPNVGAVTVYAYFTTPAAALSNGAGASIASARVAGSPNGGAFAPFTGNSPFAAGSSITVATWRILGNNRNGTRQDTLGLRIDTTGLVLPAGTYTGILNIQAQAL